MKHTIIAVGRCAASISGKRCKRKIAFEHEQTTACRVEEGWFQLTYRPNLCRKCSGHADFMTAKFQQHLAKGQRK